MTVENLSLEGKVAIVTGSGRETGIGAAIAKALARNGASVTINYVSDKVTKRAEAVVKAIKGFGGQATAIQSDVTSPNGAKLLVDGTLKSFDVDHIDILVNNAGVGLAKGTLASTKEDIDFTFGVNVYAPIFMVQAVIPHMPHGGRIINISSVASKVGDPFSCLYGPSKAALDSLSYTWASEFGRSNGITVNSIAPGPVLTDIFDPLTDEERDAFIGRLKKMIRAADRIGTLDDIADAVLLIVSEKGRWITGQYISVSGGMTGQ